MSGGEMDYAYYKVEDCVRYIPDRELQEMTHDFAELLHDLEWYLSDDTGKEDWVKSMTKFKKKWFGNRSKRLERIIESSCNELKQELFEMIGNMP